MSDLVNETSKAFEDWYHKLGQHLEKLSKCPGSQANMRAAFVAGRNFGYNIAIDTQLKESLHDTSVRTQVPKAEREW